MRRSFCTILHIHNVYERWCGVTSHRGYFGIGVYHPKKEQNIGTLMRSAYCFGADFAFTLGRRYDRQASDTPDAARHLPLYHYADIDDLVKHLPQGCPLIGVELADDATPLNRFDHPERACYLLGAEDYGLSSAVLSRCADVLVIPHASPCLNVAVAGSLVLYDRSVKRARQGRLAAVKV